MIDHTDIPTCEHPGCDDGWILGYDENWLPCDVCEAEQDAMRAERDADLDAMHAAREDTRETVRTYDAAVIWPY